MKGNPKSPKGEYEVPKRTTPTPSNPQSNPKIKK